MDRRTRLQQTVEGLSVVAISYYLVGLLGYVFKGLHEVVPGLKPEVATGCVAGAGGARRAGGEAHPADAACGLASDRRRGEPTLNSPPPSADS